VTVDAETTAATAATVVQRSQPSTGNITKITMLMHCYKVHKQSEVAMIRYAGTLCANDSGHLRAAYNVGSKEVKCQLFVKSVCCYSVLLTLQPQASCYIILNVYLRLCTITSHHREHRWRTGQSAQQHCFLKLVSTVAALQSKQAAAQTSVQQH
jgi:hypothetical protein